MVKWEIYYTKQAKKNSKKSSDSWIKKQRSGIDIYYSRKSLSKPATIRKTSW